MFFYFFIPIHCYLLIIQIFSVYIGIAYVRRGCESDALPWVLCVSYLALLHLRSTYAPTYVDPLTFNAYSGLVGYINTPQTLQKTRHVRPALNSIELNYVAPPQGCFIHPSSLETYSTSKPHIGPPLLAIRPVSCLEVLKVHRKPVYDSFCPRKTPDVASSAL